MNEFKEREMGQCKRKNERKWKMKERIYALYKGDKFITEGTKREISERSGLKISTLSFYATQANIRRKECHKHYAGYKLLIRID